MPPVGVTLGVLIGVITGIIALLIMWQISVNMKVMMKTGEIIKKPTIIALLFSIPGCWFGGYLGNAAILGDISFEEIIATYLTYLLSTFMLIMIYPLARLIIRVARDIGKQERP